MPFTFILPFICHLLTPSIRSSAGMSAGSQDTAGDGGEQGRIWRRRPRCQRGWSLRQWQEQGWGHAGGWAAASISSPHSSGRCREELCGQGMLPEFPCHSGGRLGGEGAGAGGHSGRSPSAGRQCCGPGGIPSSKTPRPRSARWQRGPRTPGPGCCAPVCTKGEGGG